LPYNIIIRGDWGGFDHPGHPWLRLCRLRTVDYRDAAMRRATDWLMLSGSNLDVTDAIVARPWRRSRRDVGSDEYIGVSQCSGNVQLELQKWIQSRLSRNWKRYRNFHFTSLSIDHRMDIPVLLHEAFN